MCYKIACKAPGAVIAIAKKLVPFDYEMKKPIKVPGSFLEVAAKCAS